MRRFFIAELLSSGHLHSKSTSPVNELQHFSNIDLRQLYGRRRYLHRVPAECAGRKKWFQFRPEFPHRPLGFLKRFVCVNLSSI